MSKSKTVVYRISRKGWNDCFDLHVSPTRKAMHAHIKKYYADHKLGEPPVLSGEDGNTNGMVQPIHVDGDGVFAIMFLNEEWLGAGTVSHECLHVAMTHERKVLMFGMHYSGEINEDEERLAYYLTDCVKSVYDALYDNKHIKAGTR